MLEVVFNDNTKGAMRVAKNYDKKSMLGGAVGGSPDDVVCIGLNLDIGDIAGEFDSKKCKQEFSRVFGSVQFADNEIEHFFHSQRKDFEKMLLPYKTESKYGFG